jgi:hypothetical protein
MVDYWMLIDRSKEEVEITKIEMANYLKYLSLNRDELASEIACSPAETPLDKGKKILMNTEINRIDSKITSALKSFKVTEQSELEILLNLKPKLSKVNLKEDKSAIGGDECDDEDGISDDSAAIGSDDENYNADYESE